jgi:3-methyladenine DNA glycosylase AlkD
MKSPSHTSALLVTALRRALRAAADPVKSPAMQAYMKSEMPYLGVQAGPFRETIKPVFAAHTLATFEAWRDAILALWRGARYREERYSAVELAGHRAYREYQTLAALPVYEEMITAGAWWDYVDALAIHRLGELLQRYPVEMSATLRQWAECDNLWKRRSAILAQNRFKHGTDVKLLYDCILPSLESREFFLRKGIGWALREYSKTDPAAVVRFVRRYEGRLSPLTRREALKDVVRQSSESR